LDKTPIISFKKFYRLQYISLLARIDLLNYRFEGWVWLDGRVVAYSGDTEWSEALLAAARAADLFICEAYFYDKSVKTHLNLKTLEAHLPAIQAKRLILTHLSPDMLARVDEIKYEVAEDGLVIEL
jgi:ribonuclease BN (tRNA processing enzyme)